jgi:thioredoxin-related protein
MSFERPPLGSAGRLARLVFALLLAACGAAIAQVPSPHAIDIPRWFATTFLDFREDIDEAARDGKRLLVYFGQDGCPYCTKLMTVNFSQQAIVDKTRRHFVATAINIFGDREVTWTDGRTMTEKELARVLQVQFTPTILVFDEAGTPIVRLDGYYPPNQFEAVLDYAAGKLERTQALGDFARELGVVYTPSVVFFDASGVEVFRIGAYLRPFHFASTFAYVASGAYRNEPSFQRYLQRRADAMRARGEPVDLWN